MNKTELDKAVNFESKEIREKPNSNEFTNFYREICKSAYAVDDYPTYAGLEFTWKKIEKEFSLLKDDRENNKFDSPLSYFMYMVEGGFYPPPEVMLALLNCFENYYQHKGKKSLDECFFGRKHKSKSSPAYYKSLESKYTLFHSLWASKKIRKNGQSLQSLEKLAEDFLSTPFAVQHKGVDVDTFLKGYQRAKKKKPIDSDSE